MKYKPGERFFKEIENAIRWRDWERADEWYWLMSVNQVFDGRYQSSGHRCSLSGLAVWIDCFRKSDRCYTWTMLFKTHSLYRFFPLLHNIATVVISDDVHTHLFPGLKGQPGQQAVHIGAISNVTHWLCGLRNDGSHIHWPILKQTLREVLQLIVSR